MNEVIFDAEFDGLNPTKIHVFSYQYNGGNIVSTNDYDEIRNFLLTHIDNSYFIGHNIIRFDIVHLCKLLEIDIDKFDKLIDTLALSWYLYPNRNRHGIESWGNDFNIEKPQIDDWHNLSFDEYKNRCVRDVQINIKIWDNFKNRLSLLYKNKEKIFSLINYLSFKMKCARLQEESGWKLDIELARNNLEELYRQKEEKINDLVKSMPEVPIIYKKSKPKVLHKKSGELSQHGLAWYDLLKEYNLPDDYDDVVEIVRGYEPPNPTSHAQIKDWLFDLGWEPTTYKQNKKKEEVPQIGVEDPDRKGELCDSVLALAEKEPSINSLNGLFVINHRIGILEGFLENVDENGFLKAEIAGFTNTLRFKHTTIVNLPGVNKPYGEYIRPVLIASDEDHEICGADMSGLEDRTKQHYIYKHDPEYVNEMNKEGFDPHLDIALLAKMMTEEEVTTYKDKPTKELKNKRHSAKTTNYSCTYGAYPPKIARTAKISLDEAKKLWETYWSRNWAVKKVAEEAKVDKLPTDDSMWLYNPVSGFYYSLRSDKDRFSTLNQGTGSYCFDVWLNFVLQKRPQLTAQFHDEGVWNIKKGHRKQMNEILLTSIEETNKVLNLNRSLDIGIQYGNNYGDVHG